MEKGLVMDLQGKVALVTGAGRGLGLAYATALARAGAAVVVNDVDDVAAKQAVEGSGGAARRWVNGGRGREHTQHRGRPGAPHRHDRDDPGLRAVRGGASGDRRAVPGLAAPG